MNLLGTKSKSNLNLNISNTPVRYAFKYIFNSGNIYVFPIGASNDPSVICFSISRKSDLNVSIFSNRKAAYTVGEFLYYITNKFILFCKVKH